MKSYTDLRQKGILLHGYRIWFWYWALQEIYYSDNSNPTCSLTQFECEKLPLMLYNANISVLLIQDRVETDPSSYQPISISSLDFKKKWSANRLSKCTGSIIHTDQTGFIPDRFFFFNVRSVMDITYNTFDKFSKQAIIFLAGTTIPLCHHLQTLPLKCRVITLEDLYIDGHFASFYNQTSHFLKHIFFVGIYNKETMSGKTFSLLSCCLKIKCCSSLCWALPRSKTSPKI